MTSVIPDTIEHLDFEPVIPCETSRCKLAAAPNPADLLVESIHKCDLRRQWFFCAECWHLMGLMKFNCIGCPRWAIFRRDELLVVVRRLKE